MISNYAETHVLGLSVTAALVVICSVNLVFYLLILRRKDICADVGLSEADGVD